MLTDELKSTVSNLPKEDQKELEHYLLKLRLECDEDYWERIRNSAQNRIL